jgi:hypothetical protein
MRWSGIKNGRLLALAEDRFDVLLTVDKSIPFQQNLNNRDIAVVVLIAPDRKPETLRPLMQEVLAALDTIQPGEVVHVRA